MTQSHRMQRLACPRRAAMIAGFLPILLACQPTIKVEAPDKPIVIDLNVKIDQQVSIKVDQGVQNLLQNRSDIF
jgi:YnbE-like lipoprotein